uniref:Uncharacterized protein n=1 Tax=Trichobilharzia regenti TaxID=157069 RepID=A0AA85KLU7_TRIRE|nr:unnamed protein product [Trichobilharzia regenti]
MSDDSDAFASADESFHTSTSTTTNTTNTSSIKESHPIKEESSSTISKAANTNDRDNNDSGQIEETASKTTEHTLSPLTEESNSGELKKKKKVKQKKLKSAPKKREKVKEGSLKIDSKSVVKEDIPSVSEIVGSEDKKMDSETVLSPSSEKIETPPEVSKSETKELKDVVIDLIVPQPDEPCEQIFDSNNPNEGVKSLPEEMTPISVDTSGDSKQFTSSMEIHSVIDKLSKVEPIPELDFIASTATNIARGLGDGLSSLVGVLGDVIQLNPSDTSVNEETLKRRAERQTEEQLERKAISDAWNNVWGTSWTNDDDGDDDENGNQNDGWEVDSPVETEDISKSKLDNNIPEEKTNIQEDVNQGVDSSLNEQKCRDNVVSQQKSENNNFSWGWSGLSSFSQLTSSLQATSLNLVQGSVDVLELIGRKTMSVLAENDPGFEYTKKFLRPSNSSDNRPNLSKILREAYELHSSSEYTNNKHSKERLGDFTYQLECHRALLHLESLELVSEQANNQLNIRLDSYSSSYSSSSSSIHQTYNDLLEKIWNYLNLDENDDSDTHHKDADDDDDDENESGSRNSKDNDKSYTSIVKKLNQKHSSNNSVMIDDKEKKVCQQLSKHLNKTTIELWCKIIRISYYLNMIYSNERFIKTTTDVWNTCDMDKLGENSVEVSSPPYIFFYFYECMVYICNKGMYYCIIIVASLGSEWKIRLHWHFVLSPLAGLTIAYNPASLLHAISSMSPSEVPLIFYSSSFQASALRTISFDGLLTVCPIILHFLLHIL